MKTIGWSVTGFFGLTFLFGCSSGPSDSTWTRLFGSSAEEAAHAVAVAKDGSTYVVGSSQGAIGETPNRGGLDAFVAKFDSDGNAKWKLSLGTPQNEEAKAVTTDKDGNVFVTGYTGGQLDGGNGPLDDQIFVAKIDKDGKQVWLRLFGETTPVKINSTKESGEGIVVAGDGTILVTGFTVNSFGKTVGQNIDRDAYLLKLSAAGEVADAKLLSSNRDDVALAVATSAADGAIYLAGYTEGTLGGDQGQKNEAEGMADAFVMRIGANENESWVRLLGTKAIEKATSLAVDPTTADVYLGGTASTGLQGQAALGMGDGFVAKFDRTGKALWQKLIGGKSIDTVEGLAVGSGGRVFATGVTWSDLKTRESSGRTDMYLMELSSTDGSTTAVVQKSGAEGQAWGKSVFADGKGLLYVAGRSGGALEGQTALGGFDAVLWKLKESDLSSVKK